MSTSCLLMHDQKAHASRADAHRWCLNTMQCNATQSVFFLCLTILDPRWFSRANHYCCSWWTWVGWLGHTGYFYLLCPWFVKKCSIDEDVASNSTLISALSGFCEFDWNVSTVWCMSTGITWCAWGWGSNSPCKSRRLPTWWARRSCQCNSLSHSRATSTC